MTEVNVSMEVRRVSEGVMAIDIAGELTAFCEDVLTEAHEKASRDEPMAILLNFERLEYMNSGGIGLLVTILIRATRRGHRVLAYGLTQHYRQIFSLTRLDEAIQVYDDQAAALAAA